MLLRRRLFLLGLISTLGIGAFALGLMIQDPFPTTEQWLTSRGPMIAVVGLAALVTALIPRTTDVPRLRRWEYAVFGMMLFAAVFHYQDSAYDPLRRAAYAARGILDLKVLARFLALEWVFVVISYGMFIPSSGRRCAAMTTVGTVVVLAVVVVLDRIRGPIGPGLMAMFVTEMGMCYALAIGYAVFGSTRMERLRTAVRESLKVGQYQLLARIGAGGMGEVFKAEHRLLKRPCAVKMIRPEKVTDPQFVRRFEREVAATTQLRHPSAVQVYDYGRTPDGTVYYVMEFLPGQTLEGGRSERPLRRMRGRRPRPPRGGRRSAIRADRRSRARK